MTPLRNKMIRELELHRKAPGTIKQYVSAVAELARHYRRSPDSISIEEVRDFIHHLITQRKVAFSTCNTRLAGRAVMRRRPERLHSARIPTTGPYQGHFVRRRTNWPNLQADSFAGEEFSTSNWKSPVNPFLKARRQVKKE